MALSGDGGAGDGGAGDGGAGDGGAGDGGAGDGGAGHAGGRASALLTTGLAINHDATVGFWGLDDATKKMEGANLTMPDRPRGYDDLTYLSYDRKTAIIGGALASRFRVVPCKGTGATLLVDDIPWLRMHRPSDDFLCEQLRFVRNYADLRMDRIAEIHTQTQDIMSYLGAAYRLDTGQRKHSLEYLQIAHGVVSQVTMRMKHFMWSPRPMDFSPNVQPIIQTPVHSSFPNGHATEAFALATILYRLETKCTDKGYLERIGKAGVAKLAMPFRIAHRIAVNRTVAGVHFPVDSAAGAILGVILGEAILALSLPEFDAGGVKRPPRTESQEDHPPPKEPKFDFRFNDGHGSFFRSENDFTLQWMIGATSEQVFNEDRLLELIGDLPQPDDLLRAMYKLAESEWRGSKSNACG